MKIWFVINSLGGGGAERLLQTLSNALLTDGHEVTILTLEMPDVAYRFHENVEVVPLLSHRLCTGPISRLLALPVMAFELALRLRIGKPDGWLSLMYLANFTAILTRLYGNSGRIVVSEHTDLRTYCPDTTLKGRVMKWACRILYRQSSAILAVSDGVAESLHSLQIPSEKIIKISNFIDVEFIEKQAGPNRISKFENFTFVTAGRLCHQKDHLMAIRAFASLPNKDCRLIILGEGPLHSQLAEEIQRLGLSSRVTLTGWHPNPYEIFAQCHVFILSSENEGFGLVLAEAMAVGLPVISTDCQSGPSEILDKGHYGLLVPVGDQAKFTEAMTRLLDDEKLCHYWSEKASQRAKDYDVSLVLQNYIDLMTREN